MKKIMRMQFKIFFSNTSQVIYIIIASLFLSCVFFFMSRNYLQFLIIAVPLLCITQIAPGLFVIEKENRILESILTLPLTLKQIFFGKALYCFTAIVVIYYASCMIAAILNFTLSGINVFQTFNLKVMFASIIFPLPMFYNQAVKSALVSLKSKDSKACAMDITLVSFLYALPCFIEITCSQQEWKVWIIVAVIYLIIEAITAYILYKNIEGYKKKSSISNLLTI